MNILEHYVTNITSERVLYYLDTDVYVLVADVICYGNIEKQKEIHLTSLEYNMVKEKGYYLA